MKRGRRTSLGKGRVWFLTILDGPHQGERLMPASVDGVYEPLSVGQRVEVQSGVERFVVEVVDAGAKTARAI